MRLKLLAWKEVLEALRDTRTLALMALCSLLLPALGVLVAGLQSQEKVVVCLCAADHGPLVEDVMARLERALKGQGFEVVKSAPPCPSGYDLAIEIPRGFEENATSVSRPVVVLLKKLVGSPAADRAEALALQVLGQVGEDVAKARVERLAAGAGVRVNPDLVLHPLRVVTEVVAPSGEAVAPEVEVRASTARFLSFAVLFVLSPAAVAVADAFVGERERRTAEMLVASPLKPLELVVGKMAGGLVVALFAAAMDAVGVVAYMALVRGLAGIHLGPDLALVHALSTLVAVLAAASLSAPLSIAAPSPRSAVMGTGLITGLATMVFFASLFVDLDKLPALAVAALYVVPFTHVSLAITRYALGDALSSMLHLSIALAISFASLAAAVKLFSPERMVRQV